MIRDMLPHDIDMVCELLIDMKNDSPTYRHVPDDWDYVSGNLQNMLQDPNTIALIDDGYRGFMLGGCHQQWYSAAREAYEYTLYVSIPWRGSTLAPRLIKAFEDRARSLGARRVFAGTTTGNNEDRTIALYERMGYMRLSPPLRKDL
ncbi:acyl-CoA N-acyltransferase [Stappia phage SI01]|uniref:Acyl-CoA N-acyltransferase n=1 Tax=Stappia phage SI01 TaxID=2847766 RepID=A0AAE7SR80_9CAUD|nr:acyl-CoA N-acyltransferase [Stappia phage SI01]